MPRKAPIVLSSPTGERICCFCGLKDDNELDYGKFHEYDGIITHYYCLLFSSNMQQRGLDDEGILGFLPGDINKELRRGRRLTCYYCKKIGATLGCCNTKCKKIFHFPCGLKAGSLHQYFGEFRSYCVHHRPKQSIDERILKEISQCENKICYICYDEVNANDFLGTIWAPCCKKNAWFHRTCVQQLAMSAGYFFKCPLCNNKSEFQKAMLDHGIFIPSQDASWELVPNAFQELLYRHNRCDADECTCPKGREHISTNAKWELTLCRTCGSQGIHMACGNLKWGEPVWECNECTTILNKSVNGENSREIDAISRYSRISRVLRSERALATDEDDEDDETSSDTDISVGNYTEMPMEAIVSSSLITETSSCVQRKSLRNERQDSHDNRFVVNSRDDTNDKIVPSRSRPNGIEPNNRDIEQRRSIDELPPLTKKPRISETQAAANDRGDANNDSDDDDDIIIVSGPSRKETSRYLDNPFTFANSTNVITDTDKRINDRDNNSSVKNNIQEFGCNIVANVTRHLMNSSATKSQPRFTINSSSAEMNKRSPIEIDLSDSESINTEIASDGPVNDFPELKIQISNVTSLAPEVFARVPEIPDRSLNDTATTNRPLEPINHDDHASQRIHEQLQIVRFDGTSDPCDPSNCMLYGLTIPGTNNTVPLIISASRTSESTISPATREPRRSNDPPSSLRQTSDDSSAIGKLSLPSSISKLAGPKSRKAAIQAAAMKAAVAVAAAAAAAGQKISTTRGNASAIVSPSKFNVSPMKSNVSPSKSNVSSPRINEKSRTNVFVPKPCNETIRSNEKSNAAIRRSDEKSSRRESKLSYSVPLEEVVNDQILLSRPYSRIYEENGLSDNIGTSVKIREESDPASRGSRENFTKANIVNSSIEPKSVAIVSSNDKTLNGAVSSPMSQIYALMRTDNFSPTIQSAATNGRAASRIPQNSSFPTGRIGGVAQNGYINVGPIVARTNWPINAIPGNVNLPQANVNDDKTTRADHGSMKNVDVKKSSSNDNEMAVYVIPAEQNNQVSSENCDGDAGSGSAVQPASDTPTNIKSNGNVTANTRVRVAATDNRDRSSVAGKIEFKNDAGKHARTIAEKYDSSECSVTTDRNNSFDRIGLMNKMINLRDLRFTVCGANMIKMTLYETYSVNINVDNKIKDKYTSSKTRSNVARKKSSEPIAVRAKRSSLTRGNDTRRNMNNDTESLPRSPANFTTFSPVFGNNISNNDDEDDDDDASNQSTDNTQSQILPIESENSTNDPSSPGLLSSRGRDELKENLDPVTPSIDMPRNSTSTIERKPKSRLRSGAGKYKMQLLNELDSSRETIDDDNDNIDPRKIANHEPATNVKSKISGNDPRRENACAVKRALTVTRDEETNSRNFTSESQNENNPGKSTIRIARIDDNDKAEISDLSPMKRPKYTTTTTTTTTSDENFRESRYELSSNENPKIHNSATMSNLVSDGERAQTRKSPRVNVCASKKSCASNIAKDRGRTSRPSEAKIGASVCCKVSIDLARIRAVLASKLTVETKNDDFHKRTRSSRIDYVENPEIHAFYRKSLRDNVTPRKSRSLDNLTINDDRPMAYRLSFVENRGWRSTENLDRASSGRARNENCTNGYCAVFLSENTRRGCKRKTRSFEKHDCVR